MFKTSEYQRRANNNYVKRKTDPECEKYDPDFKQKMRDNAKRYYDKNKTKILEKLQAQRDLKKTTPS